MLGAPALCAAAALRGGAGLVKIAAAGELLSSMIEIEPGATGIVLGDVDAIDAADPDGDAVLAIGPGMGQSDQAAACAAALLRGKRAVVLDADGLNLLSKMGSRLPESLGEKVLTPHPGEFARLCAGVGIDQVDREDDAVQLARAHGAVVVLKGQASVITDGQRVLINTTGNPAMATAGSGDVLTGLIAALMAQGMGGFEAAALGAHLHGLAGDLWAKEHGQSGLTAGDLARRLPDAFEQHRRG
jgi:NAD(P)H-hydrate epimerase